MTERAKLNEHAPELLAALEDCLSFISDQFTDEEAKALDGHPIARGRARQVWDRAWNVIGKVKS